MTVKFLTGYGRRPQHLIGTIGLLSFAAGNLGMGWLAITWIMYHVFGLMHEEYQPLVQRPLLIYSVAALLMGIQLMSIGFLAELIISFMSRDEESYSIAEERRGLTPPAQGVTPPARGATPPAQETGVR
jgi:hypothetical protein